MFLLDQTHNLVYFLLVLHRNKRLPSFFSPHLSMSLVVRLNHTITDDCNWTACLNPRDSASEVMSNNNDNQCDLGMQISNHLADLKKEMSIMKVHADDLQNLHHVILHLEAPPAAEREVPDID